VFFDVQGAIAGLLSSLGICCWIAIGAIVAKVPADMLSRSTEGCEAAVFNSTSTVGYSFAESTFVGYAPSSAAPSSECV
jgi:hypothetical protein